MTMALFNTHSGCDLSGKVFPVGHCSENSCPSAQLPGEGCRGHSRGWGERLVPACARAGPTEPGTGPSRPVAGGAPHTALSCQGWQPPAMRSSTAQLPCPWRETGRPTTPLPQRKGRVLKQKSANVQNPEEGGLNQILVLSATVTRNQI